MKIQETKEYKCQNKKCGKILFEAKPLEYDIRWQCPFCLTFSFIEADEKLKKQDSDLRLK